MTLDDWVSFSPDERNRIRREWTKDSGSWVDLLEEACDRFRIEFGRHPLINDINVGRFHGATLEPSIVVTTALFSPQLIEELPDRYLTFRVVQYQIEDLKQAYLRTWIFVLGQMLGWSETRIREWAKEHHEAGLDGKEGMFYHDDAFGYVLPLLIPQALQIRLDQRKLMELERRISAAIFRRGSRLEGLSSSDWEAARSQLGAILKEHGAVLPQTS